MEHKKNQQSVNVRLLSIGDLLKNSFEIYKKNFHTFISLMALHVVALLVFLPAALLFIIPRSHFYKLVLFALLLIIFAIAMVIIGLWVQVSLLFAIKNRNSKVNLQKSLRQGWEHITSYVWVTLLVGLVVFAGILFFIIPGIIFSIWFSLSKYVFVAEGKEGAKALTKSRELVMGNWWGIFGRILVVTLLAGLISYIPLFGPMINLFFMVPFVQIYLYLLYEDLRKKKA